MSNIKAVSQFIDEIEERGWACARCKNSHWKAVKPGCQTIYFSATPRNQRAIKNARADILRAERKAT